MHKFATTLVLLGILLVIADAAIQIPIRRQKITSPDFHARHMAKLFSRSSSKLGDGPGGYTNPLNGNISIAGEFSAEVQLGTPAQTFQLQVDTGSSDLLVYSDGCVGCGDYGITLYNSTASETYTWVPCNYPAFHCTCWDGTSCGFRDIYGDGSGVNGSVIYDIIELDGLQANVSFGMIEQSSVDFEPLSVDGIWGLAYKTIADWNELPVFPSWASQNELYPGFSLCLSEVDGDSGILTLGTDFTPDNNFRFTPVINELYYVVNLTDVKMNNVSLGMTNKDLNQGYVVVDSGTTLLLVNEDIFKGIITQFDYFCKTGVDLVGVCNTPIDKSLFAGYGYNMTEEQIAAFPNISFSLNLVDDLQVPPQAYLISENIPAAGPYFLGIQSIPQMTILGDVFMQNFHVAFDLVQNAVGFAETFTCPSA
eukprot:TRINITY_DN1087_c0_g5_i1.p1 TRINITY_DN1087_c0_g5~~TRINITY_DN1087_c0_g5_i1.p1  ORF type:complete len:436 (-),score=76.56 TRINITY_DN1087_c0_g5_i1:32-1300(-)